MKRNLTAALFFLVSLTAASCSKSIFSNGVPVTESRSIEGAFTSICIYNNVNVKVVHSDHPHLELTCPENLIDKIVTELSASGDTLIIKNNNTFNWLRSVDYSIDLTVYYNNLREITYASIGDLVSADPLKGYPSLYTDTIITGNDTTYSQSYTDIFSLNIIEGSGDINLNFECPVIKNKFSNGTSKVTLRGTAGYAEHVTRSYGLIDASELNANIVVVQSNSTNDVYVWAQTLLDVQLFNIGNIYYKGDPTITIHARTSDGELIPMQ